VGDVRFAGTMAIQGLTDETEAHTLTHPGVGRVEFGMATNFSWRPSRCAEVAHGPERRQ